MPDGPRVLVARKWVDRRPDVDPLTGAVTTDPRSSGASEADDAALEWGLRLAEAWGGEVTAATAGPAGAEGVVRDALAAGAVAGWRLDLPPDAPSAAVAAALAGLVTETGAAVVVCGAYSLDRGSGSVPAFLAAALGWPQALGLVALRPTGPGAADGWRRLDGGRRERLALEVPGVLSVEGGTARLRRAPFPAVEAAARAAVPTVPAAPCDPALVPPAAARTGPLRPRTHVVPGPDPRLDARRRILALTGADAVHEAPRTLTLAPADAAESILEALTQWGEFP